MTRFVKGAALALALVCTSCFAITDLDRFQTSAATSANFFDLRFTVRGMTSHTKELFEYRVVDASNVIQSRGFIQPLGGVEATVFVRGAVPRQNGPFRLDFFADHDNNLGYDQRPGQGDHSWRIPLEQNLQNEEGQFVVLFDHNTSFAYLNEPMPAQELGKPATVRFKNMNGFMGKRVEARIADASSKRVVALFRVPVVDKAAFDLVVPGMVERGVIYTVEIYTDDGRAGAGSVRAFRLEREGAADGLDIPFDGNAPESTGATQVSDAVSP